MAGVEDVKLKNLGMNTVMEHRAFGRHAAEALRAVRNESVRLERLLSRFVPGSDISRVNRSAGMKDERLNKDTFQLLSRAVEFSICCQGLFDITIGPLVDLWNGCTDSSEPPEDSWIKQILPLVGYTGLLLDPARNSAGLKESGQALDLGGIGKGYAGDKLLEVFKKYDISSAYSNIGGNVAVLGTKPDGSLWHVGIRHPRQENSLIGLVAVANKAVVTSGDYQRCFVGRSGKRFHHILDPSTGYPAESGLISATVVADRSTDADALSTILFIIGKEKGLKLLESFSGADAVLIDTNLQVHVTNGLKEYFQAAEGINFSILNR
jgi:thiamine biosynthesis lipoprotein